VCRYFSGFLVFLALRASLSDSSQILVQMFPNFSWEWSWKLGFSGYHLSLAFFLSFLAALFPGTIHRRAIQFVWIAAIMMVGVTLLTRVSFYARVNDYFHLVAFFVLIVCVRSVYRAYRQRQRGVTYTLFSMSVLPIAIANDILMVMGVIRSVPLADIATIVFIFSQTAIISDNYAKSFRDIIHIHEQLQKLVYRHVVAEIAAGKNLEETMPTGKHEAVVLAFDVVASSTIRHPQFDKALERLMTRCQAILHEDYDADRVSARGYRIKEMGDGLLCSIGFPLHNPYSESNADTALVIAERFCQIFAEEMATLDYPEPIYCAVGLAQGSIEGFFPKSGIRQYDLRGRALILATRYESMRNIVFKQTGVRSSLIFIQDAVYQSLSLDRRHGFEEWDCQIRGHKIRDDAQAKRAWYKRMQGAESQRQRVG
jgi:class 3 adenylate cyclase